MRKGLGMGWLSLEEDGSGGADSSPWYHGEGGGSQRGSDGAQGKESKEAEAWAAHSGCARSALGSSSPKGAQSHLTLVLDQRLLSPVQSCPVTLVIPASKLSL